MLIPYIITIIIGIASLLLMMMLGWAAWRHRNPVESSDDTAREGLKEFGPAATNSWLRGLRVFFTLLIITVFGFHSYWVFFADSNEGFRKADRFDARNRRLSESALKGWILDRSGSLENALIRYKSERGVISRDYPLGQAAVHLTGYSDFIFGSGGMEYAFRSHLTEPVSTYNRLVSPSPVGQDIKVSIDSVLQQEAFNLAQNTGKPTAIVMLLVPNNEVLAMASAPSFNPRAITSEEAWQRMSQQAEDAPEKSPLVNRTLGTFVTGGAAFYYRPGSTFKIFTAAVALDSGHADEKFICRGEGFTAPGSQRPIRDFGGSVHGTIDLREAFKVSCNQYFAQLGVKIGREKLAEYARRLGYVVSPEDNTLRASSMWHILHGDTGDFNFVFAPPATRMNLTSAATAYDIALQSIGQGYDDLTVFGMALLASSVANQDGSYVAPTFETGTELKVNGPFISPESARRLRELMRLVVEDGTARGAFTRSRITAGGKTGTADRVVPVYDSENKRVVAYTDEDGRQHYKMAEYTDSWFVGFAPADNPKIAFAVAVEDGGEGARAAAPIAAKLIEKASQLGYFSPAGNQLPIASNRR